MEKLDLLTLIWSFIIIVIWVYLALEWRASIIADNYIKKVLKKYNQDSYCYAQARFILHSSNMFNIHKKINELKKQFPNIN